MVCEIEIYASERLTDNQGFKHNCAILNIRSTTNNFTALRILHKIWKSYLWRITDFHEVKKEKKLK